ncbi:MAG: hypothetical protein HY831_00905 [Candidatus Aenigmarchaeota archaeon]|nr:hypothetical protein [Candidatus Aenigmarchaeota archaeon]
MTLISEDIHVTEDMRKSLKLPEGYSYFITPSEDPKKRFYHVSLSSDRTAYDGIEMAKKIARSEPAVNEIILPHVGGPATFCYTLGNIGKKYLGRKLDSYPISTDAYGDEKSPGIVVVSDLTEIAEILRGKRPGYKDRKQEVRNNIAIGDDIFDRGLTDEAIRNKLSPLLTDIENLTIKSFCIYQKDGASLVGRGPDLVTTVFPNKIVFDGEIYTCWVDFPWDNPKYEEFLEKRV